LPVANPKPFDDKQGERPMRQLTKTIKILTVALSLTSLVALVGCDAAPEAGAPEEETRTSAVIKGGGLGVGSFTCDDSANTCTCVGDEACNDMFGSGLCGGNASCDTSNPSQPVCTCTQALRVVKPKLGALRINTALTLAR
jgi:hypothetical protein